MLDFFFLLLFLFAFAVFLQMDWIYYVLYVVGGIWAISHWWTRRSLHTLSVSRRLPSKAFTGETLRDEIVFHNRSRLPVPWLRIHESIPLDLRAVERYRTVISIGGRSMVRRCFQLYCHRRGYYTVGPLQLYTGDLFGFAQSSWRETESVFVTVYPKVLSLADLGLPSRLPFGDLSSRQRLFQDPTRMAGVRPYASGDSLRHIHWRASAHEDTLLVKKYQPSMALNATVVLDLNREAYPWRERYSGSEWAIVLAASLANHITEQRQEIGLLCNGYDPLTGTEAMAIPCRSGRGHLMGILEILARIQVRSAGEGNGEARHEATQNVPPFALEKWLPQRVTSLGWGATLLVVTPKLTEALIWTLHSLYRRGLNVFVLTCTLQAHFRRYRREAESLGLSVHQVIWDSDLDELQSRTPSGSFAAANFMNDTKPPS